MSTQIDRLGGAKGSLAYKAPCTVATTADITLSGLQTIDGVVLTENVRVLVKNQTNAYENGIYLSKVATWVRTKDWNGNQDIVKGTRVYVTDGSVGSGQYAVTTDDPITIGTTNVAITFETPVTGPPSSTADNLASFSDGSGASLADSGIATTTVLTTSDIDVSVQGYIGASTDFLLASDLGVSTSGNPVQRYVGSTATFLTTSDLDNGASGKPVQKYVASTDDIPKRTDIGSTEGAGTAGLTVEPSYARASFSHSISTAAGLTPGSNGVFMHVTNDFGSTETVVINVPTKNGLHFVEVTNGTSPASWSTTAGYGDYVSGTPSTGASEVSILAVTRTNSISYLEWKTT